MNEKVFDVIVVGAGFAGLAASYHLKRYGLVHVVFERGRIGESWRSQRWNSFRTNSTNRLNILPGQDWKDETTADGFATVEELVSSFEQYALTHQLPVIEHAHVIAVESSDDLFAVTVATSKNEVVKYRSRQVLVTSGAANKTKIPSISNNVSTDINQIHASQYRNAAGLRDGAVLVVGSAQSGCQIAEDLLDAGRKVYLSTSMVGRFPRWYRGKDIFYWLIATKFYDIRVDEVKDLTLFEARPPQISGTGSGRDSLSLQSLARKGAVILGRLDNAKSHQVFFQPDAAAHVKYADDYSEGIKKMINNYIATNNISAPSPHYDVADIPDINASCASTTTYLDLKESSVTTIIWSTGFTWDLSYLKLPVLDHESKLIHEEGVASFPGIYFLGFPWLLSRKSSILFGIIDEVQIIVDKMHENLTRNSKPALAKE